MPKCDICGKELKDPKSKNHISSQYHQKALKKLPTEQTDVIEQEIKVIDNVEAIINSKFVEIEKKMLKERLYSYIINNRKSNISDIISHFQKFFSKDNINSLLLDLYFENLINFDPKVPNEIEKIFKIIYEKKYSLFPLTIKLDELKSLTDERFLNFENIINIISQYPDYVQFSPISIGKSEELITFKQFWKSNSRVWVLDNGLSKI